MEKAEKYQKYLKLLKKATEKKPKPEKKAKGGSTDFGMLSVKAGIDKNPNPTKADRIAGAKMQKKTMGGMVESRGQKSIQIKKVPFRGIY
jgi:hypothetical protein